MNRLQIMLLILFAAPLFFSCNSTTQNQQGAISQSVVERYQLLRKRCTDKKDFYFKVLQESTMPPNIKEQSKSAINDVIQHDLKGFLKKQSLPLTDDSATQVMNTIEETMTMMDRIDQLKNPTLNEGKPWDN